MAAIVKMLLGNRTVTAEEVLQVALGSKVVADRAQLEKVSKAGGREGQRAH